eukprot:GILJ01002388.1.p1 GENE.GILJ01002388.1~~GILJ01002388.1.p1  ORF type:complete len:451 (+),score=65.77 GILJ01002388.1:86-1438(+)
MSGDSLMDAAEVVRKLSFDVSEDLERGAVHPRTDSVLDNVGTSSHNMQASHGSDNSTSHVKTTHKQSHTATRSKSFKHQPPPSSGVFERHPVIAVNTPLAAELFELGLLDTLQKTGVRLGRMDNGGQQHRVTHQAKVYKRPDQMKSSSSVESLPTIPSISSARRRKRMSSDLQDLFDSVGGSSPDVSPVHLKRINHHGTQPNKRVSAAKTSPPKGYSIADSPSTDRSARERNKLVEDEVRILREKLRVLSMTCAEQEGELQSLNKQIQTLEHENLTLAQLHSTHQYLQQAYGAAMDGLYRPFMNQPQSLTNQINSNQVTVEPIRRSNHRYPTSPKAKNTHKKSISLPQISQTLQPLSDISVSPSINLPASSPSHVPLRPLYATASMPHLLNPFAAVAQILNGYSSPLESSLDSPSKPSVPQLRLPLKTVSVKSQAKPKRSQQQQHRNAYR